MARRQHFGHYLFSNAFQLFDLGFFSYFFFFLVRLNILFLVLTASQSFVIYTCHSLHQSFSRSVVIVQKVYTLQSLLRDQFLQSLFTKNTFNLSKKSKVKMHSVYVSLFAAGLATLVQAQDYTAPTDATWGPLLLPDLTHPVTQGEEFTITWDPDTHPTSGVTVSLVLCKGPSTNCVPQDTAIATGLAADLKQYEWSVPCDLTPGVQATSTGYGMLVIVDGTGEFQYSTQFSVLENKACSGSTGGPTLTSTVTPTSSLGPPGQQTGTAYTGSFTGNGTWTYGPSGTKTATPDSTDSAYTINTYTSDGAGTSTTLYTLPTGSTTPASQTSTGSASGASSFPGAANQLSWNAAGVVVAGAAALFAL